MLDALEQGNLFLVPLDDRRQWYRYHHLFADVLQAHLLDEQPDDIPELHRRASIWYEQNGDESEAIDHALAAQDFERAADLIELAIPALSRDRREATLRSWLKVFPEELLRVRPVLNIGFVGRWCLAVRWRVLRRAYGMPTLAGGRYSWQCAIRAPIRRDGRASTSRTFRAFRADRDVSCRTGSC